MIFHGFLEISPNVPLNRDVAGFGTEFSRQVKEMFWKQNFWQAENQQCLRLSC
jgi:hypothetical protein